jgi:hypothetical protein
MVQPAYAMPCVPLGHDEEVIAKAPPADAMLTVAVAVDEPDALVAFSVYVVFAVGLTFVEPLAAVDVKLPGVMAMLVAPVVAQLSVLLDPEGTLVGLALKEVMVGVPAALIVTVAVDVAEPDELVAVSVYIVVAVGLTIVEPLADAELNPPGEIEIVVAPLAAQLSVLLAPELMLAGLAPKDVIVGADPFPWFVLVEPVVPAQPAKPPHAASASANVKPTHPEEMPFREPTFLFPKDLGPSMCIPPSPQLPKSSHRGFTPATGRKASSKLLGYCPTRSFSPKTTTDLRPKNLDFLWLS